MVRMMKKRRVDKLLMKDTLTVFDFFSTKCNLLERRKKMRQYKQHAVVT